MKTYFLIFSLFLTLTLDAQVNYSLSKSVWNFRISNVSGRKPITADFAVTNGRAYNTADSTLYMTVNGVITAAYAYYPYSDIKPVVTIPTVTSTARYTTPKYQKYIRTSTLANNTPILADFTSPTMMCINWADSTVYQRIAGVITKTYVIYPLAGIPAPCVYTYSEWGECQPNGTQTRTVISSSPSGCTGTPVLTQSCTYNPPVSYYGENNYYISSTDGNDSYTPTQAHNSKTPWRTIGKLNTYMASLMPGDSVLFKRGDTFYGTITVNKSGATSAPIVISAYGSGLKPTITGFVTLSAWTNEGGGIYSKTVTCETKPNLITINGKQYGMGRYPNVGSDLIYESCNTNVSITDNQLASLPNWTGAEAVIRKTETTLDRCLITNHTNTTITYSNLGTSGNATVGYYYFIQNDLRTLDQFGEWYYDGTKLSVFFGANNPMNYLVKVPTLSQLLYAHSRQFITVTDLSFGGTCSGKNNEGGGVEPAIIFFDQSSSNTIIKNCSLDFCGANGITLQSQQSLVDNNTINNVTRIAIEGLANSITVTNNAIKNSGIIQGASYAATRTGGVWNWGSNCLYQFNTIDSVAKTALAFWGNNVTIKNNFITHFNIVMNDGGGIYTDNSTNLGRIIDGNIVLFGVGNKGKPTYEYLTTGIYLDSYSSNVTAKNNTVAFLSHSGFLLSNNSSNIIQNNTSYDNARGIYFLEWSVANSVQNNIVKNNIILAKNISDATLQFQSNNGTIGLFGISDSNFFARPIADNTSIQTFEAPLNNNQWQNRTLANWQSYTGQDSHSYTSPIAISNTDDIRFEYNATQSNKTVALTGTWTKIDGTTVSGTITLLPYTSIILLK